MKTLDYRLGMVTDYEARIKKSERGRIHFNSGLPFLKEHKGFRPGCLHGFLGLTSGGKSTLCRTMVNDLMFHNEKAVSTLVWLSEDDANDWVLDLVGSRDSIDFDRLVVCAETNPDLVGLPIKELRKKFVHTLEEAHPDILILDNTTTSALFGTTWQEHKEMCAILKKVAQGLKMPIVYFSHTGAQCSAYNRSIIEPEQMRGFKDILNISEYFYVLQSFHIGKEIKTTVRITKHRLHNIVERFFMLDYSDRERSYNNCFPIDFSRFKSCLALANTLKGA